MARTRYRHADDQRLARLHRAGDRRARSALIERHLPLARALARRLRGTPEEMEDLVQVASLGLVKAVDGWDPALGFAFSSFAVPTILGELRHHLRDSSWCVRPPRRLQELSCSVEAARRELRTLTGREPTIAAIAERVGRSPGDVREAVLAGRGRTARALDGPPDDDDEREGRAIADGVGARDTGYERAEARATIDSLVGDLDDRARKVLRLRFDRDLIQSEIAAEVGCSQIHVSRILAASLVALRVRAVGPAPADA